MALPPSLPRQPIAKQSASANIRQVNGVPGSKFQAAELMAHDATEFQGCPDATSSCRFSNNWLKGMKAAVDCSHPTRTLESKTDCCKEKTHSKRWKTEEKGSDRRKKRKQQPGTALSRQLRQPRGCRAWYLDSWWQRSGKCHLQGSQIHE